MDNDNINLQNDQNVVIDEEPIITIVRDDTPDISVPVRTSRLRILIWLAAAFLTGVALCGTVYYYWRNERVGIPVSCSPQENIAKLQAVPDKGTPAVVLTKDSILGVALNIYELQHLKGEITFDKPTADDESVYLYSRSADYMADGGIIGSMTVRGERISDGRSRLGYCAMANGNTVIGVARNEKVRNYVEKQGGCFFRQFILVSNGVIPIRFYLHGKVERRALGRKGNHLYFLESRHPETMWDFADALREYGFVDAIYLTGGRTRCFYRHADGSVDYFGQQAQDEAEHLADVKRIPWLVFKAMD